MSYTYKNVVIKPGLYLGDQGVTGDSGGSSPIFSSMQLSLDGTNDLSNRDDIFVVLPGYKAILYKSTPNTADISYVYVYEIDNTYGTNIRSVWYDVYNTAGANQISKVDLFYQNVKIDYSNIKPMGFKASARLCWGAKLGQHSDGSYNKYALILESSTPRSSSGQSAEQNGLYGYNRPYLSLPWVRAIRTSKSSYSFWWCSKGYENSVNDASIDYTLGLYGTASNTVSGVIYALNNSTSYTQIFFFSTGNLAIYQMNSTTSYNFTSSKNICDGLWHHIVWNMDGNNSTIYTDGVPETFTHIAFNMGAITSGVSVIGNGRGALTDITTNGYIADFRFYKNVLSTTDINGLLNGDHTYRTTLDTNNSCLFQYTFDPSAVYTNNYTTYAIGAATVPYAAELRNGADIILPSMDLTDSLGKNIKIYPFTIGANGFSISFWWRSDGLWATQGANSRLFYLGNGDEITNITFSLEIGSNGYPSIGLNYSFYPIIDGITPLIWYKFDGNLLNFGSGTGLDGTGTPSYSSSTVVYGTQSLAMTSSFNVPSVNLNSLNGITFSWWVNSITSGTSAVFTNGTDSFDIQVGTNAAIRITAPTFGESLVSDLVSGQWNHLAVSMTYSSGTTSTWKSYLNGILKTTFTDRPYFSVNNYTTNTIGNNNGLFDDFRIYQTVLTDEQVLILNNINNAFIWYKFDGNVLNYGSGTGLDGTLVGTASYDSSIYKIGSQSLLSNTSSYISIPTLALNTFTNGLTIAFWFYRTGTGAHDFLYFGNNSMKIYSFGNNTSYNMYFEIPGYTNIFYTFPTINTWNHFAVTLTYSTNNTSTWKLYIDGILNSTYTNKPYPTTTYSTNYIGKITGYMDDFSIYKTVLSDTQILNLSNNNYNTIQNLTKLTNYNNTQNLTTLTNFCDDTWKHVVWTIAPDLTWKLYVNNALINTYTGMGYPDVIQRSTNYIGSGYLTTDGYPCGFIGDFRMYNAVLSSDNVASLYKQTDTLDNEMNLIQHYDFVEDTMNANNNILYSNAPRYALELTNSTSTTGTTGQYGSMPSGLAATGTSGLTISFWWKSNGWYTNQGSWARIFDSATDTTGDNIIAFACKNGTAANPYIEISRGAKGTNSTGIALSNLTDFCDGDWKHVVWTMTNATTQTSTWNLYVNNQRYGLGNLTTTGWYPNNISRNNFFIGRSYSSADSYPNGYIADVRVYKEVFTPEKITDLYNKVYTSETNLLLHTIYPTKTAPTLNNGAKIPITSKTELKTNTLTFKYYRLVMNGTSLKYAQASLTTGLITNAGVSFAFWFKPTGSMVSGPAIFDFGSANSSANNNIYFVKSPSANYPFVGVWNTPDGSTTTNVNLTTLTDFFSNQVWKHVVWTMTYSSGNTSIWNVYINSIQYGSAPITTTAYYPTIIARTNCFIGKSIALSAVMNGQIADFRVYNSVLTQSNVTALYNGTYTDESSLFLNYPIDAAGTTNPNTITFTLFGSPTISQEKPPSTSLYLATDSSLNYHRGSYLSIPPLVKTGTNGLSFSIWWKSNASYPNQGPWSRLFSFSNGKARDTIEFILNRSTLGYPAIQVHNGIKFGDNSITSITSLCDGTWKHIVWTMTYCGPTQNTSTWTVYLNGTATTVTTTGTYPKDVLRKYAYIGQSASLLDGYPTGDFADFRVYGAVLTQANVDSLYALTDTTDKEGNLLLRQKFDSTESYLYQTCDNIKPSVLFENDPDITITSSGQHVVLPTLPGLLSTDVPDERGISISFWWKSKGLSGTSGMLFESGLSQNTDVLFLRTRSGLNTYMSAQYYYGINADVDITFAAGDGDIENLENGEWHHIVWTLSYEGNGQRSYWKYYMDGYFIKTTALNTTGYLDGVNNTYALKQVNNFIGRSNWASINGCLNGYMSDFRIYNKCLTTQDVGDLYTDMYYDNSDLFLRYSFEKKIQIDNLEYTNIKAENDPSIIILLENGGATVVDNDTANSPSGFSSFLQLTGTTRKWARPYLPKSFASNQLGLSFSFWFKPTGSHGTGNPMIFDFGNAAGNNNVYFAKQTNVNYPYLGLYKGTTSSELIQLSNTTGVHVNDFFSNQVWKHIVWTMTYSASNTSTWNVYFNGQQYSGTAIKTNANYPIDIGRTGNYIGDSNWTTNGGLSGNITGFRIYTTALTQANATALYNNTFTDTTNLFFSTDFKPKYNINLTPSHSTDTTQVARLYNGATLSTDTYKFGTSSLFLSNYSTTANVAYSSGPGYGQCMQTIAPLPKLGTNGISFSFWWKSAGLQGSSSTIFDFAEDANNRITFYDVSNNSTSPIVQVLTGSGTKYDYNLNKENFNNGDWHHVVWNIDKFNNTWEIFYDNVSSGTINNEIYPDNVSRPFCFFGRSTVSTELYANGYIDEFRIYSKALTSTDVANLYTNIDTTSLQENLILYYSFNQDACRNVMDEMYIDNNVLDTPIFNT